MKHVIRPAARDDIIRQYRYYLVGESVPDVASRFVDAVEETISAICRMPEIGAPRRLRSKAVPALRAWPVRDFEDVRVYYLAQDDLIRVVRVLHGKRDIARILAKDVRLGGIE